MRLWRRFALILSRLFIARFSGLVLAPADKGLELHDPVVDRPQAVRVTFAAGPLTGELVQLLLCLLDFSASF